MVSATQNDLQYSYCHIPRNGLNKHPQYYINLYACRDRINYKIKIDVFTFVKL